jgi:hypothetical protein
MAIDHMRILLVEDAPDIREVFTVLLRVEGADVTATGTGREAAELASRREFDVVMSDLGLPDMPGVRPGPRSCLQNPWSGPAFWNGSSGRIWPPPPEPRPARAPRRAVT